MTPLFLPWPRYQVFSAINADSTSRTQAQLQNSASDANVKVVVRAEILPRDFLETLGNYYLSLTVAKFKVLKNFTVKKFRQFLKALNVKLSIFKNKTILIKV